jgi:hypothetical protein
MANPGSLYFNSHFTGFWILNINITYLKWLTGLEQNGCA